MYKNYVNVMYKYIDKLEQFIGFKSSVSEMPTCVSFLINYGKKKLNLYLALFKSYVTFNLNSFLTMYSVFLLLYL